MMKQLYYFQYLISQPHSNTLTQETLSSTPSFIYFNQIQFIRIQMDRPAAPLNYYPPQNLPFTSSETRYIVSSDNGRNVFAESSGRIVEQSQTYQFRTYNPERPASSSGEFPVKDSKTVNRSQMIGQSQLTSTGRASRYNNKYSFKRHSTIQNPLGSTIQQNNSFIQSNNQQGSQYAEVSQYKIQLQQKDALLAQKDISIAQREAQIAQMNLQLNRIRDLALERKIKVENLPASADNVQYINTFIQIYNISIATSKNEKYSELQAISFVPHTLPPSNQVNNIPINPRPLIPQPQQPTQVIINPYVPVIVGPSQQGNRPIINYIPHQPSNIPNNIDNFNPNNNFILPNNDFKKDSLSSEHFISEIRELRTKIELLEEEKTTLIDKIRYYERNNGFSNLNSQQTIETYRHEIENLKIQINELTQLYNGNLRNTDTQRELTDLKLELSSLNQTLKEYEVQLLQAQQHIIYLENSRQTEQNQTLESEVTNLRNTIARYTEHLEQVDLERQKFEEMHRQKEQENEHLIAELNKLHGYLEELQLMNEKLASQQAKLAEQIDNSNMIDRDSYYELLVLYGRKEFQSIVLLEEINRLNVKFNECHQHLEKAEDFIIQLQESLDKASNQPVQSESILYQSQPIQNDLEAVHDQYRRQIVTITHQFEVNLSALRLQNTKLYSQIDYLNKNITALQEEIYRLESSQTNFVQEYQEMQHKYKSVVEQLNVKYDELHSERSQLTHQLAEAHIKVSSALPSEQEEDKKQFNDLEASIAQLNDQLAETTEHLKKAEDYIEQNLHAWSEKKEFEIHYQERLVFIEHLTRDFELLKLENQELATRLYDFENVVHQVHILKEQNAKLIGALKENEKQSNLPKPDENELLFLRDENSKLANILREFESQNIQLTSQFTHLTSLKQENGKLLQKINDFEAQSQAGKNIQIQGLRDQDAHNSQLAQEVNFLREENNKLISSIQNLEANLIQSHNRIQILESSNEAESIKKELEFAKHQINESNSKLMAFNTVVQELQILQGENEKLFTALRQTEELHNSSRKHIEIVESSISNNHQTLQTFEEELITLRQQNIDLRARLQASDELIHQIHTLKAEQEDLLSQLRDRQTALLTSRTIFQEIENELRKEADINRISQQELGEANRYISQLKAKLLEAEDYIRSAETFIHQLQQNIKETQEKNNELRSHLEGAEHYIRDMEERSIKWQHERDQFVRVRHTFEQDNIRVHLALKNAESHIFELEEALKK